MKSLRDSGSSPCVTLLWKQLKTRTFLYKRPSLSFLLWTWASLPSLLRSPLWCYQLGSPRVYLGVTGYVTPQWPQVWMVWQSHTGIHITVNITFDTFRKGKALRMVVADISGGRGSRACPLRLHTPALPYTWGGCLHFPPSLPPPPRWQYPF